MICRLLSGDRALNSVIDLTILNLEIQKTYYAKKDFHGYIQILACAPV